MLDYQQLIDLGLSPDLETLTARAVKAAEAMGFGLVSGVLVQGRFGGANAVGQSFGNPPAAFGEASRSLDKGMRDPLLGMLLARPGHATYSQATYVQAGSVDMWDLQASFGYRSGLSLSIHQPSHAEVFMIGVDGAALPTQAGELLRLQAALQMIGLHAQSALQRLMPGGPPPAVELPTEERQALQIASATIYARRGNLVEIKRAGGPRLASAVRRTGSSSLTGAILRAVESDQIQR